MDVEYIEYSLDKNCYEIRYLISFSLYKCLLK